MRIFLIVSSLLSLCGLTHAGNANGKITSIEVPNTTHAVIFGLNTALNDTPRCNVSGRFAIDLRKPGGSAAYRAILEAKREQYVVNIIGLNTCTSDWKSEDVKTILLD